MSERYRAQAREHGMLGCAGFARAFNLTDDAERPWCVSEGIHERATCLLAELVHLVETADLERNPKHAALRAAREDKAVQQVIAAAAARQSAGHVQRFAELARIRPTKN